MSKILISIVSHDQQHLVKKLLCSFERYLIPGDHEITIILTENCDIKINLELKKFQFLTLQNIYRKGFGANHNDAFIHTQSDYFFIVNPDISLFQPFDVNMLINFMELENISITSPQIISTSGQICDFKRADLTPLNIIRRRLFHRLDSEHQWLAGMFFVTNSRNFKTLNGFDTNFFMYVEDCDLCMRAVENGMKIRPFENLSVVHDEQRASRKHWKYFFWHVSSLLKYWYKHFWRIFIP